MTKHSTSLLALGLGALLLTFTSPAYAGGKKKAAESEEKSVDDMMSDAAKPKKASEKDDAAESDKAEAEEPKEEEVAEPDEWEKPPEEEEKAQEKAPEVAPEEKVGDDRQLEAGLLLGWGFETDKGAFSTDPYQLGFGLRLGYEFDFKLFVGVGFEYFLGTSGKQNKLAGSVPGPAIETSANYMFFQAEAGYDLWFGEVILRPSLWLGAGAGTQDPHPLTNAKKTVVDFFFGPGVSVLYVLDGPFIGGDMRLQKVTGDGASAFVLYLTGGLRF